ncbi:MAG: DMT family transporter [Planctomycetota bacterium]
MRLHRAVQTLFIALLLGSIVGCGPEDANESPPNDEAMRRLRWENDHTTGEQLTEEEAAKEYFLPEYYYDPGKAEGDGVDDYFPGMDRIVVRPDYSPEPLADGAPPAPPLKLPVFQLIDVPPGSRETEAIEKPTVVSAGAHTAYLPQFHTVTDPLKSNREILGRNTWMLWCGGNEGFWDWLGTDSLGFIDLLKLIDSRDRSTRFERGGLINEPEMRQSGGPSDEIDFGLWLDVPEDGARRRWRAKYLDETFKQLRTGMHPSQRGLKTNRQDSYEPSPTAYADETGDGDGQYDVTADSTAYEKYPPPDIYGLSSGVVGLRLFPNPYFDAAAQKKWEPERYYNDRDYWNDPKLVRPFRVGVSCAYCHASFHPLNPPRDVNNPQWANISGSIGAQYLRIRLAFSNLLEPDNFVYHLLDSQPPGTIDTSLIPSDNVNNPNTMNAVFNLTQRALVSLRNPKERISAESATQPSIWDYAGGEEISQSYYEDGPITESYLSELIPPEYLELIGDTDGKIIEEAKNANSYPNRRVPRILLDGSDSIGAWGALARVYLNIGTYWEQWQRLHRTVVGFKEQDPFTIQDNDRHSLYWHATEDRVAALRDYFIKVSPAMPLLATDDATSRLEPINEGALRQKSKDQGVDYQSLLALQKGRRIDTSKLKRGRKVFAQNCIVCHSSIQPERWHEAMERTAADGEFWIHDPASFLSDPEYIQWAERIVEDPEFWRFNFLSCDYRVPINLVNTNAARAMATNALDQNMWDDFASESYQDLPSVGAIEYFDPYDGPDGATKTFTPRHQVRNDAQEGGGGPGFYRVPTLVSVWSTAPLLHNNSLGTFNNDPSINGRLDAFDDAIRKLLWPERRLESSSYNGATAERLKRDQGLIWRTPHETDLAISGRRVPTVLGPEIAAVMKISDRYPWLREVRPRWLPSAILLLAAFLLLCLNSEKQRLIVGVVWIVLATVTFLLWFFFRDAPFLAQIHPLRLVSILFLLGGAIFLTIDCTRRVRYLAYLALATSVLGFGLYLLRNQTVWLHDLNDIGPIAWASLVAAGVGVLLLLTGISKERSRLVGWGLLAAVLIALVVYFFESKLGAAGVSSNFGPLLVYILLAAVAVLVLLTPGRKELVRYFGYGSLVLALATGGLIYFFSGAIGDIRIGPIPKGTPVSLLANLNPDAEPKELAKAIKVTVGTLAEIESKNLTDDEAQTLLREKAAPALMEVSKCPDFVMDHGHYYEWFDGMTDDDKEALIELLKTF